MSGVQRIAGRKDVREEAAILARLGFRYQGTNNAGHHVFDHRQHGEIVMANSPSAFHWRRSHRRQVAKVMGITAQDLACLIHGQATLGKRKAQPKRTRRRRSVALRHLRVAPETIAVPERPAPKPAPVVTAFDPCDPISGSRRDQWAALQAENVRANLANPYPWKRAA